MKLLFILLISLVSCSLSKAQYSEEVNKMLGIAPRDEVKGTEYKPIKTVYDSAQCFTSTFAQSEILDNKKPEPKIKFLFHGLTVLTSYPFTDPKSRIIILGEIDSISDKDYAYRRFQCKDNSGSNMVLSICYEFISQTEIIILVYSNSTYYYEIHTERIPNSVKSLMDNKELCESYLNNLSLDLKSNQEVESFVSQFGSSDKVLKLLCK